MTTQTQKWKNSEYRSLALLFLITFTILGLVSVWLIYQQFAQVQLKGGQCTVLAIQSHQDPVDTDNPTNGAAQYAITFTVSLLTADGKRLTVPGYYTSTNYDASDQATIERLKHSYAVGSTANCSYTYLDPSGIKAIFQPAIPLEGFLFPTFFLLISLIFGTICLVMLRRGPAPEPPLSDELLNADGVKSDEVQQV